MRTKRSVLATSAVLAGLALVAVPGPDGSLGLGVSTAQAQGQGVGQGGDPGGGRGLGRGPGGSEASAAATAGGFGQGRSRAPDPEGRAFGRTATGEFEHGHGLGRAGLDDDAFDDFEDGPGLGFSREDLEVRHGAVASELKGYNAAHALPALDQAADGSMIGAVREYQTSQSAREVVERDLSEEAVLELRDLLGLDAEVED